MRIQAIWKLLKGKHELWAIVILITFSLTLLNTVSYMTRLTQATAINEGIADIGTDIHVFLKSG
ncbi:hypothetical protein NEF87_001871 [Candidatus Lokiarchaeum ossiferum]|uniref:ABC transporter permease n=1 Tax=Candidatus Lokiarchaeum ossiferum TaxID=2951803 RepID=A0ABY6HSQ5_9ARCH|nr:hypothetical protein NEF87_001871 [Candidatus Lokiarchaeum sp. B-35]